MPTIPTVFRPIRANDVQRRSFKAYKNYTLTDSNYSASGAEYQEAMYTGLRVDVNDPAASYPENADGTNRHIYWNAIDHKYYRHPYDPARTSELSNRSKVEKLLFTSASIITIPYMDVGERIKPGSVTVTATPVGETITFTDDGYGNLRDLSIDSSSFASASRNVFYLSFNETFRDFDYRTGAYVTSSVKYRLNGQDKYAQAVNIDIVDGIQTTTSSIDSYGLAGSFKNAGANAMPQSHIRIPHEDIFNNFQRCDDWTISLWFRPYQNASSVAIARDTLLSKLGPERIRVFDNQLNTFKDIDKVFGADRSGYSSGNPPRRGGTANPVKGNYPFHIDYEYKKANETLQVFFHSAGESGVTTLSSSLLDAGTGDPLQWKNVIVRNSGSSCQLFINGDSYQSSQLPENTTNKNDILIGRRELNYDMTQLAGDTRISEIRMYDYAVSNTAITSLSTFESAFQTNVVGNVFYRNGQAIVSSPSPKYNSGSGYFGNTWQIDYKGQHTIYENEVMVRVPAGELNVSMNPSSTYRPATGIDNSCNTDGSAENNGPGEYRKAMFVSGSVYPYVTTIGLYNDAAEMVAIGKLATPVQKRDDVDMNFVVRWDH